ncbi:hypothetical protein SERLADRAFT_415182 [Serpula lacrymans var. lacrymans S7.9]|uniref:DBF4-type domain-containing protein n=1 Tax=Serpula lacrymans var. lacrymans (strain S7.9) TaxID=578457 RepID=F8NTQ4_SERL9|nr:uncharacterized protein SERLADRAFT_415182 [Serpula lacrymans var. lacrymans S7.9]EGO25725.1 hypothetical protein SERLADRAFT_415182 [Serpula lacrymans var. lacrymans S7.9]
MADLTTPSLSSSVDSILPSRRLGAPPAQSSPHDKENVPPGGKIGPIRKSKKVARSYCHIGKSTQRGDKSMKNSKRRVGLFGQPVNGSREGDISVGGLNYNLNIVSMEEHLLIATIHDVDRRAKELTESPLAEVTEAYDVSLPFASLLMAAVTRRPLTSRPIPPQVPAVFSPSKAPSRSTSLSAKRARSPEPAGDVSAPYASVKRPRAVPPSPSPAPLFSASAATREDERRERERKRAEREAIKEEFRIKYTRAFPSWVFYFDLDLLDPESAALRDALASRVSHLGGRVDDFFSNEITHLITNQVVPSEDPSANKENVTRLRSSVPKSSALLKSPIKLRGRPAEDSPGYDILVQKALKWGMKIWNTIKLDSILERCDVPALPASTSSRPIATQGTPSATTSNQRSLTRLLASERLHGTTTERDPTQKRHDFRYFSKSSYFVLVEDVRQEVATIHALEYPISRGRDGKEKGAWPTLHCHPKARGPFIEFDEKERRRWEKSQKAEADKEKERIQKVARELKRKAQAQMAARKTGDLRRSVSMNNLHRRAQDAYDGLDEFNDFDGDCGENQDSANASGYLASTGTGAYIAASGNSVGITSTTGTTSNAGNAFRTLDLPASLRGRIQQQVVTSRKVSTVAAGKEQDVKRAGTMGPPVGIPERPHAMLRKSRSTNTLKLPKREEGSKPGYCESCRVKFDDFNAHIQDRKHRKFATNDANYLQLDFILGRVTRRTRQQVEENERIWAASLCSDSDHNSNSDVLDSERFSSQSPHQLTPRQQDIDMWDDELDAEGEVDLDM